MNGSRDSLQQRENQMKCAPFATTVNNNNINNNNNNNNNILYLYTVKKINGSYTADVAVHVSQFSN